MVEIDSRKLTAHVNSTRFKPVFNSHLHAALMSVRYQIVPTEAPGDGEEEEKNLHRKPGLFNKISGSAWSVPILFAIIFVQSLGLIVASSFLYWRSHPVTAPRLYCASPLLLDVIVHVP